MQQGEFRTVQALRAGACLAVVLYHGLLVGWPHAVVVWPNGSAGVDVFFVVSGFVMASSVRSRLGQPRMWQVFLRRRLIRVLPLYWLLTSVKLALLVCAPGMTPHTHPDPWNVLASFLFVPARDAAGEIRPVLAVGWTLNFEMLFYGLFALALALRLTPWRALIAPLGALAIAGFWRTADWPAGFSFANGLVLEFAFGMALAEASARQRVPARPKALVLLGVFGVTLLPLAGPWRFVVWGAPAVALVAGMVALESSWGPRIPRWVLASGDASYATYLSHPFLGPILSRLGVAAPLAAIPLSAGLGWAVHAGIDRRLRRLLTRHRYGGAMSAIHAKS